MQNSKTFSTAPYLRTSRDFPEEPHQLSVELERSYIDIANVVNQRIIGNFPVNAPTVTGEAWFLRGGNSKQQTQRQVYTFSGAGTQAHGINTALISGFTRIYGTFTTGTLWGPLPYVSSTLVTDQIALSVDATNITIAAGATAPTITSAFVVLEWLSNV